MLFILKTEVLLPDAVSVQPDYHKYIFQVKSNKSGCNTGQWPLMWCSGGEVQLRNMPCVLSLPDSAKFTMRTSVNGNGSTFPFQHHSIGFLVLPQSTWLTCSILTPPWAVGSAGQSRLVVPHSCGISPPLIRQTDWLPVFKSLLNTHIFFFGFSTLQVLRLRFIVCDFYCGLLLICLFYLCSYSSTALWHTVLW